VFESRQYRSGCLAAGVEIALDLHDRRDGIARLTEEFQADRADIRMHAVKHPAGGGDQAVAALLLHAGQAPQKLIRHILAQAGLAEASAFDGEPLGAQGRGSLRRRPPILPNEVERRERRFVNPAEIMVNSRDLEPVAVRIDHPPPGKIVHGRPP
jgi:hypothetical protein